MTNQPQVLVWVEMHHFEYKGSRLFAEDVDLAEIAAQVGTPTYVYSQATLTRHFEAFKSAFSEFDPLICFAVKANSNKALMALFASMGGGADIVSGGEMFRALNAGVPAKRIVYSGVGKTLTEMREALEAEILIFNLESAQEMQVLNQVAGEMGRKVPVGIRVNPDVNAKTHPKITTGMAKNKFGVPVDETILLFEQARDLENLEIKGVSCHIGSQLTELAPFADTIQRMAALINKLRADGHTVEILDLGGGLGITYDHEIPPLPNEYADALRETISSLDVQLILEPGRVVVGNAGILLCEVNYTKQTSMKRFVVVDAAMNDLIRPAFYNSYHGILPLVQKNGVESVVADVVGPICESSDFLARDREMPRFERGDFMALMSAGAYCFSMSSNYNSRPRAAEVLVNGDKYQVIRKREVYQDLVRGEELPAWL